MVATDKEQHALDFTVANAAANGVGDAVSGAILDWADSGAFSGREFDCVLAADVVYDVSAPPLLARLLHAA